MAVAADGSAAVREFGVGGPVDAVGSAGLQLQADEALVVGRLGQLSLDRRVDQSEYVMLGQEVVAGPLAQGPYQFRSIGQVSHSGYGAKMDGVGRETLGHSEMGKGSQKGRSSGVHGLTQGPKEARHGREHDEEVEMFLGLSVGQ